MLLDQVLCEITFAYGCVSVAWSSLTNRFAVVGKFLLFIYRDQYRPLETAMNKPYYRCAGILAAQRDMYYWRGMKPQQIFAPSGI